MRYPNSQIWDLNSNSRVHNLRQLQIRREHVLFIDIDKVILIHNEGDEWYL